MSRFIFACCFTMSIFIGTAAVREKSPKKSKNFPGSSGNYELVSMSGPR
jgi:hypothetical protein